MTAFEGVPKKDEKQEQGYSWSKEAPEESGRYWLRTKKLLSYAGAFGEIVDVYEDIEATDENEMIVRFKYGLVSLKFLTRFDECEWFGPLPEPDYDPSWTEKTA